MDYDFNMLIDRKGTWNVKWDTTSLLFGRDDVLPMSIADMDFAAPPEAVAALKRRAAHPIYGYNLITPMVYEAVAGWCKRRHNWDVNPAHIVALPGVVTGLALAVKVLSKEGDGVIVQPPVYPPFFDVVRKAQRQIVENRLLCKNDYYEMDFDDLEEKAKDPRTTLMILCSPQNPVGRVWKREELERVYAICKANNVKLIVDEIHHDIVYSGVNHTMVGSMSNEIANSVVTMVSVGKTFNLAGLSIGFTIISNDTIRTAMIKEMEALHLERGNVFGGWGAEAAYRTGDTWVNALLHYLEENRNYILQRIQEKMSHLHMIKPEGTYLAWIDFREYFDDPIALNDFLVNKAKLGLNLGAPYGSGYECFARLNFAVPRRILEEALHRLEEALRTQPLLSDK